MKNSLIFIVSAFLLLTGCNVDSNSNRPGSSLVGEPLPRAIAVFGNNGVLAECTQHTLTSIPGNYGAKRITSSKTQVMALSRYETCRDAEFEEHSADSYSRYEYSDDYYRFTKRNYSYGGVYEGSEDTQIRTHQQGNSITHAYGPEEHYRQRQWSFEKVPNSDGLIEQFTYTTYGSDGRYMNRIKSKKASYQEGDNERIMTLPFTVERSGYAEDVSYLVINGLLLFPEQLSEGDYVLRMYLDNSGQPIGGGLERRGVVEFFYEKELSQMYAYRPDGSGSYDDQLAGVVSF